MKKVLQLLLLVFVMCQCNTQHQPKENTNRDKYPEKFTDEYIGNWVSDMADTLCEGNPYDDNAFNDVLTKEYKDLLQELLALPEGVDGDGPSVWEWIGFSGELCSILAVTDVNVTGDKAKVTWDSEIGEDELSLVFVDGRWLIDDFNNCSKSYMKNKIQVNREKYKSVDWPKLIQELEERGYSKEEAPLVAENIREQIEDYFSKYPE